MALDPEIHKLLVRKTVAMIDKLQTELGHEIMAHVISMKAQEKSAEEIVNFVNAQCSRRVAAESKKIVDLIANTCVAPDAIKLKTDPDVNPNIASDDSGTKH